MSSVVRDFAFREFSYKGKKIDETGWKSKPGRESSGFCSDGWKEPHARTQLIGKCHRRAC